MRLRRWLELAMLAGCCAVAALPVVAETILIDGNAEPDEQHPDASDMAGAAVGLWHAVSRDEHGSAAAREALMAAGDAAWADIADFIRSQHEINAENIDRLVAQLDAETFDERERAARTLVMIGPKAGRFLKKHLKDPASPEAEWRLREVVRRHGNYKLPASTLDDYLVLAELLTEAGSVEALKTAAFVRDLTFSEPVRAQHAAAVDAIAFGRFQRVDAALPQLLRAGRYEAARRAIDGVIDLAEYAPSLPTEALTARREFVDHLAEAEKQLARAADGAAAERVFLLRLLDFDRENEAFAKAPAAVRQRYAWVRQIDEKQDHATRRSTAGHYEKLAESALLSRYGRAIAIGRARDLWYDLLQDQSLDATLRSAADARTSDLDAAIARLGQTAAAAGVAPRYQRLTEQELAKNLLIPEQRVPEPPTGYDRYRTPRTWYVIGPFAAPVDRDAKNQPPPESEIDLEAEYTEQIAEIKDRKAPEKLTWQKVNIDKLPISPYAGARGAEPKNAVFYAYTELRMDRPQEMHAIFGCDDTGDLWINGEKVWSSDRNGKSWNIDQDKAKLQLDRGLNRILFRLDNYGGAMGFSMLLAPVEQ